MFKVYTLFVFVVALTVALSAANKDYRDDAIIIKVKQNTELFNQLLVRKDSTIEEFTAILGENKAETFISGYILEALSLKEAGKNNRLQSGELPSESLARIFRITFNSQISSKVAAQKLSRHPDLEYAEQEPIANIVDFIPNDTLFDNQYYIRQINAVEAWDSLKVQDSILVAICDTGVDWMHQDLKDVIYLNYGENGVDGSGNDKRTNGLDDDGNGFIDDWHGWDMVGTETPDNNPMPGNSHGTHVAGIVGASINNLYGIVGVSNRCKLLPVKVGSDNPSDRSVQKQYDGILYGYIAGAKVMNCSWGSGGRNSAEQEIINTVSNGGMLIVAASGNDGEDSPFYPASYDRVVSVAACTNGDRKASFSNYNSSVDILAPGVLIMSTIPNNAYTVMDGTSMASPVVAAVASMVMQSNPDLSIDQVSELLKVNTDNIDSINPGYKGKLGRGRVNALKAITNNEAKSVILQNKILVDANGDKSFDINERISINFDIRNILMPVTNLKIKASSKSPYINFSKHEVNISSLATSEVFSANSATQELVFNLSNDVPINSVLEIEFEITENGNLITTDFVTFTANPSYRTISSNNITTTINSSGNIGFNDYPSNIQGEGFKYKNSSNLLYEGGLIVATGFNRVWDVNRNDFQSEQSIDFNSLEIAKTSEQTNETLVDTKCRNYTALSFQDSILDKIIIKQKVIQPKSSTGNNDVVYTTYTIKNESERDFDSLYVGLYFDWDLGPSGANNQVVWLDEEKYGYVENTKIATLPKVGAKLLSNELQNFYALDNNGNNDGNIGVYDGYTKNEKWITISGGVQRLKSSIGDVSMVTGAGPMWLSKGEEKSITFALFAASNLDSLGISLSNATVYAKNNGLPSAGPKTLPVLDSLISVSPNPFSEKIRINFSNSKLQNAKPMIYDMAGKLLLEGEEFTFARGYQNYYLDTKNTLASGSYLLRFRIGNTDFDYLIQTTK